VGLINPGQSYLSSGDPRAHFGLGPADTVDEVRVDWPHAPAETFSCPGVDRVLHVERGKGQKVQP
jgi:hypothetical protein